MFGTDIPSNQKVVPHIEYFKEVKEGKKISKDAYDKIVENNAVRVLKLK